MLAKALGTRTERRDMMKKEVGQSNLRLGGGGPRWGVGQEGNRGGELGKVGGKGGFK